ncbi:hypothetical protein MAM1_0002c00176 [Mucor ambiguus]|uniref:Transcription factor CBF/NF-Y/archaeal histone domain-containing protein n=1 Tax=Mucor ambiguus TaxID=91626 RepID=A0A0C9M3S8_9FUNG|nr:hypothetical protein MAM1_0002c00176 [Mucor ambiguus]
MPAEKKKPNAKLTKLYSRTRFKKSIESGLDGKNIAGDTDILMYMNFLMFLERLANNSERAADERGSSRVNANDVNKYLQDTLREFRG